MTKKLERKEGGQDPGSPSLSGSLGLSRRCLDGESVGTGCRPSEKGGGDNIGITSMVTKSNATVQQSNIEMFCDAQLQMITDMSKKLHKKKVSEYNCDIYKYPNGSKWSVITSYTNVFTIYPTHAYSVEFVHPSNLYKRYILNLTCGPNYCDQLKEKFYEIIQSINFE